MLTEKYRPKNLSQFVGNEEVKEKVKVWLLKWLKGVRQKPILIYGKPGVGKTSLAYALANEYKLDLIEVSSSEVRDKEHLRKKVWGAMSASSLFSRGKLILIDDVDAIPSKDRGGISYLAKLLSNAEAPVILTANDAWDKRLAPLRKEVILLEMKGISPSTIYKHLHYIAKKEGIKVSEEKLKEIARKSEGDLRSALNDLEALMIGYRDRKSNIFDVLRLIFKAEEFKKASYARFIADVDIDTLKLWLSENIAEEYERKVEIANAFNVLSRADIFDGRVIKRQYWGFMRYSFLLATAGIALAKAKKYRKFTKYRFPSYLREMASTAQRRAIIKSICRKIGKRLHLSPKRVKEDLELYSYLILNSKDKEKAFLYFRLNEEERKFLEKHYSKAFAKKRSR